MEKKSIWVVTLHYNRGHVQVFEYEDKVHAVNCLGISVFKNEDCINASIYRKDVLTHDSQEVNRAKAFDRVMERVEKKLAERKLAES